MTRSDEDYKLLVAEQVVATITRTLEEVGYSQLALSYIYDILLEGLMAETEHTYHEVLEAMQEIQNDELHGNEEEITYVN